MYKPYKIRGHEVPVKNTFIMDWYIVKLIQYIIQTEEAKYFN
jgi:hypothetical protein